MKVANYAQSCYNSTDYQDRVEKWQNMEFSYQPCDLGKAPKMKTRINIYLNKEDRKKVDNLKVKYQLSLTTIIDVLMLETTSIFNKAENRDALLQMLFYEYMYSKGQKTSITLPKETCEKGLFKDVKNKSKLATNVIKIYLEHDIKKYINDTKLVEKYYNECNTKLNKATDNWWNYNQSLRYQRRMFRENKEYFRKVLES